MQMRLWAAAGIIALVVVVGFALSVPHTRDLENPSAAKSVQQVIPPVVLHDSFKKGVHTITGSVEVPNACTNVTAAASLINDASHTQVIQVALSIPFDSDVCLELPTSVSFSTTLAAPADLPFTATVNGQPATSTRS